MMFELSLFPLFLHPRNGVMAAELIRNARIFPVKLALELDPLLNDHLL